MLAFTYIRTDNNNCGKNKEEFGTELKEKRWFYSTSLFLHIFKAK